VKLESAPQSNNFITGEIEGVLVRPLRAFADQRGWLTELFRNDSLEPDFHPVMAYISATKPGITRGPHEHEDQADYFCFLGPSNFRLRMWDNRRDSPTRNHVMTLVAGSNNPTVILVPAGVVHAYQNLGDVDGIVINCPNRLYAGEGGRGPVDEIRHEKDPNTIYRMD